MKKLSMIVVCLFTMALVALALLPRPVAATTKDFQKRGLDRYTQRVLRGASVVSRVQVLKEKNKGVARAMRDFEKKGFRPAFDQGISILNDKDRSLSDGIRSGPGDVLIKASFQSETYSNDGYEMTFISYDDGNPNTWEGVIYEHDPDGYEYEYTASIDISGQQETWARLVETYYPADGSTPVSSNQPQYYDPSYHPYTPGMEEPPISKGRFTEQRPTFVKTSFNAVQGPRYPVPDRWRDRVNRWLRCSAGGCTASAIGCIASGPGWPACFGWWCAGSAAGCGILTW